MKKLQMLKLRRAISGVTSGVVAVSLLSSMGIFLQTRASTSGGGENSLPLQEVNFSLDAGDGITREATWTWDETGNLTSGEKVTFEGLPSKDIIQALFDYETGDLTDLLNSLTEEGTSISGDASFDVKVPALFSIPDKNQFPITIGDVFHNTDSTLNPTTLNLLLPEGLDSEALLDSEGDLDGDLSSEELLDSGETLPGEDENTSSEDDLLNDSSSEEALNSGSSSSMDALDSSSSEDSSSEDEDSFVPEEEKIDSQPDEEDASFEEDSQPDETEDFSSQEPAAPVAAMFSLLGGGMPTLAAQIPVKDGIQEPSDQPNAWDVFMTDAYTQNMCIVDMSEMSTTNGTVTVRFQKDFLEKYQTARQGGVDFSGIHLNFNANGAFVRTDITQTDSSSLDFAKECHVDLKFQGIKYLVQKQARRDNDTILNEIKRGGTIKWSIDVFQLKEDSTAVRYNRYYTRLHDKDNNILVFENEVDNTYPYPKGLTITDALPAGQKYQDYRVWLNGSKIAHDSQNVNLSDATVKVIQKDGTVIKKGDMIQEGATWTMTLNKDFQGGLAKDKKIGQLAVDIYTVVPEDMELTEPGDTAIVKNTMTMTGAGEKQTAEAECTVTKQDEQQTALAKIEKKIPDELKFPAENGTIPWNITVTAGKDGFALPFNVTDNPQGLTLREDSVLCSTNGYAISTEQQPNGQIVFTINSTSGSTKLPANSSVSFSYLTTYEKIGDVSNSAALQQNEHEIGTTPIVKPGGQGSGKPVTKAGEAQSNGTIKWTITIDPFQTKEALTKFQDILSEEGAKQTYTGQLTLDNNKIYDFNKIEPNSPPVSFALEGNAKNTFTLASDGQSFTLDFEQALQKKHTLVVYTWPDPSSLKEGTTFSNSAKLNETFVSTTASVQYDQKLVGASIDKKVSQNGSTLSDGSTLSYTITAKPGNVAGWDKLIIHDTPQPALRNNSVLSRITVHANTVADPILDVGGPNGLVWNQQEVIGVQSGLFDTNITGDQIKALIGKQAPTSIRFVMALNENGAPKHSQYTINMEFTLQDSRYDTTLDDNTDTNKEAEGIQLRNEASLSLIKGTSSTNFNTGVETTLPRPSLYKNGKAQENSTTKIDWTVNFNTRGNYVPGPKDSPHVAVLEDSLPVGTLLDESTAVKLTNNGKPLTLGTDYTIKVTNEERVKANSPQIPGKYQLLTINILLTEKTGKMIDGKPHIMGHFELSYTTVRNDGKPTSFYNIIKWGQQVAYWHSTTITQSNATGGAGATGDGKGMILVYKYVLNPETGEYVRTWEDGSTFPFQLQKMGTNGYENVKDGTFELSSGKNNTSFTVEFGNYQIVESKTDGYTAIKNTWMDYVGGKSIVKFYNYPSNLGTISLHKTANDGLNPSVNLAGAEFTLYSNPEATEKVAGITNPVLTDEDGNASFTGLPVGVYYIKETATPEGYDPSDTIYTAEVSAPVPSDQDSSSVPDSVGAAVWNPEPLEISNNRSGLEQTGSLTFQKVDQDGNALINGVEFTLTIQKAEDDRVASDYSQMANPNAEGIVSFTGLPYGTYLLTESKVPEGYAGMEPKEIVISKEIPAVELDPVVNVLEEGSIYLLKVDQNRNYVRNAEFTLTAESDGETWVRTSDSEGRVEFTHLPYGRYTLTETRTPNGYTGSFTWIGEINGDHPGIELTALNQRGTTTPPDDPTPEYPPYVPPNNGGRPTPNTPIYYPNDVIIPDDPVPLMEPPAPDDDAEPEEIPDDEVPLAAPVEEEEIIDDDVPLAGIPKTGDTSAAGLYLTLAMLSAGGALALNHKRKKDQK